MVTGIGEGRGKGLVYGDIAAELRRRIEAGEIPPGAPVGTLRSLAGEFRVAKGTVERALGQLREENWVYSRTGSGVFALGPEARRQAADTVESDLGRQLAEIRETLLGLRADLAAQALDLAGQRTAADERLTDLEGHVNDLYSRGGFTRDDAGVPARRAGGPR